MSDYTDAMWDGVFCQCCGELLIGEDEEPQGFPGMCGGRAETGPELKVDKKGRLRKRGKK